MALHPPLCLFDGEFKNTVKRSKAKRPTFGLISLSFTEMLGCRCLVDVRANQTNFLIRLQFHRKMTPMLGCSGENCMSRCRLKAERMLHISGIIYFLIL